MTVLNPAVTRLNRRLRIPRALSVLIVYIVILILLGIVIGGLIPPLVDQSGKFINQIPELLGTLPIPVDIIDQASRDIMGQIGQLPTRIISVGVSVVSNLASLITVLIIALYLIVYRNKLDDYVEMYLSKKQADRFTKILDDLELKLGGWARAQIILMLLVGVTTYIGLLVLNVPYALPLAVLAGFLEFVPNLGPILAAIPAVIVGLSIAPLTGIAVAALYFLIQQLEAYLLVPQVMQRSVGVNPVISLIALIIGLKLAGIVGALLAVPVFLTLSVLFSHLLLKKDDN